MIPHFEYEYVTMEELYIAYRECRKNKRRTSNAVRFEKNEARNLYDLYIDLNTMRYTVGKSIVFCVEKPVKREVFAADFRDRIVHHLFMKRTMKAFDKLFIQDTFSCRVGKGTLHGVKRLYEAVKTCSNGYTEDCYILKCDIRSFFMSIDKRILYDKIRNDILLSLYDHNSKDFEFMDFLLKKIVFNCPQKNCIRKQAVSYWDDLPHNKSLFFVDEFHGLPIGNLTSQIFANYYLSDFDHFIFSVLGFEYYGRYVDDFYIVDKSKERLLEAVDKIRTELSKIGLVLHPNKTNVFHYKQGVKFIGSVVKEDRLYIGNRTKGNAWNVVNSISNEIIGKGAKNVTKEDIKDYQTRINSYLGFMAHGNTYKIRAKQVRSKEFEPILQFLYPTKGFTKVLPYYEYDLHRNGKHERLYKRYRIIDQAMGFKKKI